jgi:hypothetical protein
MTEFKRSVLLSAILGGSVLIAGCGGSGGGSSDSGNEPTDEGGSITPPQTSGTGVFLDSKVAGLRYVTPTSTGLTNQNGEFEYQDGEVVFFLVGSSLLGQAVGSKVITPLDMADENSNPSKVANMLRFLQSLDSDDNPDNGIDISETTRNQAEVDNIEVDFDMDSETFADQQAVGQILSADGKALITEEAANQHFNSTLTTIAVEAVDLRGTWFTKTRYTRDGQTCATVAETTVVFDETGYTETGQELNSEQTLEGIACNTSDYSGDKLTYANAPDDLPGKGCTAGVCAFSKINKYFPNWEAGNWQMEPNSDGVESQQYSVVTVKYNTGEDKITRTKTDYQRNRQNGEIVSVNTFGTFTTIYRRQAAAEYVKDMRGTWSVTFANTSCPDTTAEQTLVYGDTSLQVTGEELNLENGQCVIESMNATLDYTDPALSDDICGPTCSFEQLNGTYSDEGDEIRLSHQLGSDVIYRTKGVNHRQVLRKID